MNFRQNVSECKRILGVDTRCIVALRCPINDLFPIWQSVLNFSLRNRPIDLRICGDIVERPSSKVKAGLIDHRRGEVKYPPEKPGRRESIGVIVSHWPPLRAGICGKLVVLGKEIVYREHAAAHVVINPCVVLITFSILGQENLREFKFRYVRKSSTALYVVRTS